MNTVAVLNFYIINCDYSIFISSEFSMQESIIELQF
jgi:hypothetical protein